MRLLYYRRRDDIPILLFYMYDQNNLYKFLNSDDNSNNCHPTIFLQSEKEISELTYSHNDKVLEYIV